MKKWFKRNRKQIFALVLVCLIACATCISASALNSSHIDSITVGGSSVLSNSFYGVTEQLLADNRYLLNASATSDEKLSGTFECTLYDFYVDSTLSDNGVIVYFNMGFDIGDTSVTFLYSESLDSEILTLTRNFDSPSGADISIPYSAFEFESFYIHSVTITSTVTNGGLSLFDFQLNGVSEFERTIFTVLDDVLNVFSSVGTWISTSVQNFISMFFVEGALTFLGVLGVAGLAISVIFLLLSILVNFLRFRG